MGVHARGSGPRGSRRATARDAGETIISRLLKSAISVAFVLLAHCGGEVRVDSSAGEEIVPEPAASEPDECRQHTDRNDCCAAGCRIWPGAGAWLCISESHDCAVQEGMCADGEQCVQYQTSGRGGCSPTFDLDTVGLCMTR